MNLKIKHHISIFLIFILLYACESKQKHKNFPAEYESKKFQDKLIEVNKHYVKRENDEIDQYIAHRKWEMTTTGTGLRYMILKHGKGMLATKKQTAVVNYKISLLDGTLCYSSDINGVKQFLIGEDNIESGLHEGIEYLHQGDKAVFILPSYIAYGLIGDESKIPPQASVVYEIELLTLK